jgi:hypothetical protein
MRATDLQNLPPRLRFLGERLGALGKRRHEPLVDRRRDGHVNRRREHVVRALAHVHVVVRVDRLLAGESVASAKLDRPIGDHLVRVHVARRARTGLIDIDRKLVVEPAVGHLAAGLQDRLDLLFVEAVLSRTREFAQIVIGFRCGIFHQPECVDQFARQRFAGDRKILDRAPRLRPVIRRGRQADLAHRIRFNAKFGHVILP